MKATYIVEKLREDGLFWTLHCSLYRDERHAKLIFATILAEDKVGVYRLSQVAYSVIKTSY